MAALASPCPNANNVSMEQALFTCPYCNSRVTQAVVEAGRVRCPRCGEILPASVGQAAGLPDPPTGQPPATPFTATGRPNRAVAAWVLGVMGLMAGLGLVWALWTNSDRAKRHPKRPEGVVVTTEPPAELPALGYMPRDVNLVAGVRPADLLGD